MLDLNKFDKEQNFLLQLMTHARTPGENQNTAAVLLNAIICALAQHQVPMHNNAAVASIGDWVLRFALGLATVMEQKVGPAGGEICLTIPADMDHLKPYLAIYDTFSQLLVTWGVLIPQPPNAAPDPQQRKG